jgi:mannose-6-phosphate isomerase-like protein (cupin superfamily)/CDGSH-type Zn-finger protein
MPEPVIASLKPYLCELRARQTIAWCRCGRSRRQPYCDGRSHLGTGFEPLRYQAGEAAEEVLFCGCKHTGTPPFCDGTHSNLPGGYRGDDRSDELRASLRRSESDQDGVRRLDESCYVVAPRATRPAGAGPFWLRKIISPALGALHQSQFYLELDAGSSPVLTAGDSSAILFIAEGSGTVEISGRPFPVLPGDGVHVRPGEAFRIAAETRIRAYVSALPAVESLGQVDSMPGNFDDSQPRRIAGVDIAQRTEMGPRYFQMLVDRNVGSTDAAQFIGHIPPSRAEMHRHLYEEALIILAGEGIIWNEQSCARISAGDVVFLPRKHAHSLECVAPEGMDVVGVIHPGDNPGINY